MVPGFRAPFCMGMTQDKAFYSFEAQAGRPAVVVLAGTVPAGQVLPVCTAFAGAADRLARFEADLLLIIDAQNPSLTELTACELPGVTRIFCFADFFRNCGFDNQRPTVFVMDRNLRIATVIDPAADPTFVATALDALAALPIEAAGHVTAPAPVLMIPNIFDAAACRALIAEFEGGQHERGGMASIDRDGNAIHKIDDGKKKREDYVIPPGSQTARAVLEQLAGICLPEMKKAFQFDAAHTDRIVIARYDHTGGYFKRHRDNVAPAVAFRQFALSVNLNTDYEGGHLTFPEYNGHRYRPGRGAGIIFSASLLHEAMPVTEGARYVLLTFFHSAEMQARRLAA